MVELTTRRRGISKDGASHHDKLGFRNVCVRVNLPSPIRQVRVLIRHVITPIQGLPNQIMQVVPLICHFRSYPPCHPPLHPPSLGFSCTTHPSSRNTKLSHPSWSLNAMIMSCQPVQHMPSAAFTKYSIHQVQHSPSTAFTKYSIHQVQHSPSTAFTEYSIPPRLFVFPSFSRWRVDPWM